MHYQPSRVSLVEAFIFTEIHTIDGGKSSAASYIAKKWAAGKKQLKIMYGSQHNFLSRSNSSGQWPFAWSILLNEYEKYIRFWTYTRTIRNPNVNIQFYIWNEFTQLKCVCNVKVFCKKNMKNVDAVLRWISVSAISVEKI